MQLSRAVAQFFTPEDCSEGRVLFDAGKVRIQNGDEDRIEARVSDKRPYDVLLVIDIDFIECGCSCSRFMDGSTCRHIWAAILAAENESLLHDDFDKDGTMMAAIQDDDMDDVEWEPIDAPDTVHGARPGRPVSRAAWRSRIGDIRQKINACARQISAAVPAAEPDRTIFYAFDRECTISTGCLVLSVMARRKLKSGKPGKPQMLNVPRENIRYLPDPADREILTLLYGADQSLYSRSYYWQGSGSSMFTVTGPLLDMLIPLLVRSGRLFLSDNKDILAGPLRLDAEPAWDFRAEIVPSGQAACELRGRLERGGELLAPADIFLIENGGWFFAGDRIGRASFPASLFPLISSLKLEGDIAFAAADTDDFLGEIMETPGLLPLLPEELGYRTETFRPVPCLTLKPLRDMWHDVVYDPQLVFDYGGTTVPALQPGSSVLEKATRRIIARDTDFEQAAAERIRQLGVREVYDERRGRPRLILQAMQLPALVQALATEGWRIETDGRRYRAGAIFRGTMTTDIDWFELKGAMHFDDVSAGLPELLKGLRDGENTVVLDDGSIGIIPPGWQQQWRWLTGLGEMKDDHLRFGRSQAALLDIMLADLPDIDCDAVFRRAREELRGFSAITPLDASPDFRGALRVYQREGLAWLDFLNRFGFGGCLADDMGLGKTVQVLAFLDLLRARRETAGGADPAPALVVVPRSLLHNWKAEAARFTPRLRVIEHFGTDRHRKAPDFSAGDIVLTTYGTLRRDIGHLKDIRFGYAVLDEAQAVKNAATLSAKAVRLINADHRLALSGTPVENHIGELWSLIEFLNPGMAGSARVFKTAAAGRDAADTIRPLLARALKPLILRRTKGQVARDLPERTEQTIWCELDTQQRKEYNELRDHFRATLLERIGRDGIGRAKMHVLEALLRLRQAACHPGLIDKDRRGETSAKLESLIPQIEEVIEEGHKAVIFSQFTSLLAIVRDRLDRAGTVYAYLDGRTRDRGAQVDRFQQDPDCRLFLISIKAGGLGLNLTAAEYVFILDPWWNPAVEAQAIDRAHRIGQTRQVFAYRLITADSVEEKVLDLQQRKRDLADAIITADNSLIRNLTREDLELLLG